MLLDLQQGQLPVPARQMRPSMAEHEKLSPILQASSGTSSANGCPSPGDLQRPGKHGYDCSKDRLPEVGRAEPSQLRPTSKHFTWDSCMDWVRLHTAFAGLPKVVIVQ